jgi:hypothetical protein
MLGSARLRLRDAKCSDAGNEWIVGGSCFGSPARMSFFALNMGIQQTCNEYHMIRATYSCYASTPHSLKSLGCFVDDDYVELLSTKLVAS